MEPEPEAPRGLDLLTVALFVFFLSLIVIATAVLILPTLAG